MFSISNKISNLVSNQILEIEVRWKYLLVLVHHVLNRTAVSWKAADSVKSFSHKNSFKWRHKLEITGFSSDICHILCTISGNSHKTCCQSKAFIAALV